MRDHPTLERSTSYPAYSTCTSESLHLSDDLTKRLSIIVGGENLDLADHATVIWPSSTDQVSAILEVANELRVQVSCAGSSQTDAGKRGEPLVLIQRERLRGDWEYIREDLLLSVGAGVALNEISSFLESDNLVWPGMIGLDAEEQIAHVLDSAPGQVTREGRRIRRFLYGLTVVLPIGEIVRVGSRTVKSVAGYDLKSLYLGSRSCFGIITECDLKLASKEEVLVEAPDYDGLDAVDGSASAILDALDSLKKKLDPNGILPSIESVGLNEGCLQRP